jgi:hypothetical protein
MDKHADILEALARDLEKAEEVLRSVQERIARLKEVREYLLERVVKESPKNAKKQTQVKALVELLEKNGAPMSTLALTARLRERGYGKSDDSLRAGIYSAMHKRKDLFVLASPGTWDLVNRKKQ